MSIPGQRFILRILLPFLLLGSIEAQAEQIRVAVASNFTHAAKALAKDFEAHSGHQVQLIFGSTGKHYAQIKNGAPFDLFLAADKRRPELLESEGQAIGNRITYAIGQLVLWSPKADYVDNVGKVLDGDTFKRLAIANPRLAPYGKAAQQVLQSRQLWRPLLRSMVRGENIAQAYQYVKSGNTQLGFVAYSQLQNPGQAIEGSYWRVPAELHDPIEQQAVLLKDGAGAQAFFSYLSSEPAKTLIRSHGYRTL
ncbi:MAG: molybdate ABC transporter substrate-binding protein [Motiliproteus sp.]|nr:molybdate ABC transporter substrate-binding protein [Motiliproteus sp.]MCW9054029.1 molybdate ABC transporter substrate-binding protein [Motiliproteus sp.]